MSLQLDRPLVALALNEFRVLLQESFLDTWQSALKIDQEPSFSSTIRCRNRSIINVRLSGNLHRKSRCAGSSKQGQSQFPAAVQKYASEQKAAISLRSKARRGRIDKVPPRCCLGLFAATDALGLGFVHGVPPHIYLEHLDLGVLRRLGLSINEPGHPADAYIRIRANREAIFRAAVLCDGIPVSDVLQVWLEVSTHTARGEKQADEIRRRALGPLFGKK